MGLPISGLLSSAHTSAVVPSKKANVIAEKVSYPEETLRQWVVSSAARQDAVHNHNRGQPAHKLEIGKVINNSHNAPVPDYDDAAKLLDIDPQNPVLFRETTHELRLKPWQVQGLAFMIQREKAGVIPGGVNSDVCGLGKTIQALWSLRLP